MVITGNYESYSASDYYDAVTSLPEQASEAVYYLLKHRLSPAMHRVYELHGFGLEDHYDDTIDDFFLYLYDRGVGRPFGILETVRLKGSFFGWTVGAYRNFLINKAKEEAKRKRMMEDIGATAGEEERLFSDDALMRFIALAIAFADQELPPRKLFIFYRMLLSILNPRLGIPQEAVANVLGMHPVTYRVCVNRMRKRLSGDVGRLEKGETLPLDQVHLLMSNRLFCGFEHLYDLLMPYYEATLQRLPMALEVNALRGNYGRDGILMHEEASYSYPHRVEVRILYQQLKS